MYADNEHKFVAILNKKIPLPTLFNALGHMAAGIGATATGTADSAKTANAMEFLQYKDADGGLHPQISKHPFIILAAKNGNQLRHFRQQLQEQGLPFTDFTHTMLGSSAAEQLEKTRACPEADLEYYGICTFGAAEGLDVLTKKFSLFSVR